jgi:hypothetical protein
MVIARNMYVCMYVCMHVHFCFKSGSSGPVLWETVISLSLTIQVNLIVYQQRSCYQHSILYTSYSYQLCIYRDPYLTKLVQSPNTDHFS